MNFKETLDYLSGREEFGVNLGLSRVRETLRALGDPQDSFGSVVVAGTNGKGSSVAMLDSILSRSRLKIGMYTSPHLLSYTERIRIDGVDAGEEEFADSVSRVAEVAAEGSTVFEILTAAAFVRFAEAKVDIALLEVGLGGKLDATNVVDPIASAITNVSLDHTEVLGRTVRDIAGEKAGVIRKGRPLVTAVTCRDSADVISDVSGAAGAPVVLVRGPQDADLQIDCADVVRFTHEKSSHVSITTGRREYPDLGLPLRGGHQARNLAVAVGLLERLEKHTGEIPLNDIASGLKETRWPGRSHIFSRSPMIILDGAHNPAGALALRRTLESISSPRPMKLVLGAGRKKDVRGILSHLAPVSDLVIATRSTHSNAASPEVISKEAARLGKQAIVTGSLAAAVNVALHGGRHQTVVVTGSLFAVADAIKALRVL